MLRVLRNWETIALVLALLLVCDGVARVGALQRLFDPADGSIQAARWRYASLAAEPDIVLMGDSRAVMGLSPNAIREEVTRLTKGKPLVVNVAVHGSSMEQSALFFSEVVLRTGKPDLIVLNVSEVALNDAAWTTNPPVYLRGLAAPLAMDTWRTAGGRLAVWETLSGLARLQHRLRLTIEGPWIRYWRGTEHYDWGAMRWYGQMGAQARAEQLALYRDTYLANFEPNGDQMRHLANLLGTARAQNVRLLLLLTPVTPEFLTAFPASEDVVRFKEAVSDLAAQYGVPLIDYYQLAELSGDMFFDLHHTNAEGTQRFSMLVAQDVVVPALADWGRFQITRIPAPLGTVRQTP